MQNGDNNGDYNNQMSYEFGEYQMERFAKCRWTRHSGSVFLCSKCASLLVNIVLMRKINEELKAYNGYYLQPRRIPDGLPSFD